MKGWGVETRRTCWWGGGHAPVSVSRVREKKPHSLPFFISFFFFPFAVSFFLT